MTDFKSNFILNIQNVCDPSWLVVGYETPTVCDRVLLNVTGSGSDWLRVTTPRMKERRGREQCTYTSLKHTIKVVSMLFPGDVSEKALVTVVACVKPASSLRAHQPRSPQRRIQKCLASCRRATTEVITE